MELSGCKALLLAALIVSSARLLHGPAGRSAAGAGSPGLAALPSPGVGGDEEAKQPGPGDGEVLPLLGRGVRACFPAGAVGRFHQAMLVPGGGTGSRRREDGSRSLALEPPARLRTTRMQVAGLAGTPLLLAPGIV